MHTARTWEEELRTLRSLCDGAALTSGQRRELLNSLEGYSFQDPEHQVVFESIRFLDRLGGISPERLAVHLNNRGFPDVDLDKYFPVLPQMAP